jgi:hypothetical protein
LSSWPIRIEGIVDSYVSLRTGQKGARSHGNAGIPGNHGNLESVSYRF